MDLQRGFLPDESILDVLTIQAKTTIVFGGEEQSPHVDFPMNQAWTPSKTKPTIIFGGVEEADSLCYIRRFDSPFSSPIVLFGSHPFARLLAHSLKIMMPEENGEGTARHVDFGCCHLPIFFELTRQPRTSRRRACWSLTRRRTWRV